MASEQYQETVYGQILPLEGDDDSEPGLMILMDGEEEFIVDLDKNGMKLMDHIDKWVTAEGLVSEDDEELRITVKTFKLDEDWEYNDDDKW